MSLAYLLTFIPLLIIGTIISRFENLSANARVFLPILLVIPIYYLITKIPGTDYRIKKGYRITSIGLIVVFFFLL